MNKEMRPETLGCTEQASHSGILISPISLIRFLELSHCVRKRFVSEGKSFYYQNGRGFYPPNASIYVNVYFFLSPSSPIFLSDSIGFKLLQVHSICPYYKQQLVVFYTILSKTSLTVYTCHDFWRMYVIILPLIFFPFYRVQ